MRRATERPGTRPAVHEHEGVPTWDGALKGDVGTEWLFDFDDGWQAVYHPSDPASGVPFSRRGTLELHLPPAADPAAITAHLERLSLRGRPVSREEAELTYLERNAWAQGLTGSAAYQQIHAASAARVAQLASTLAFQSTDPLTPQEAILRAEREVGRQRVAALRGLLEKRMRLPQSALASDPRYRPAPVWDPVRDQGGGAAGHWRWTRIDVDPQQLNAEADAAEVYIHHGVTGKETIERLKHILRSGVLAALEKRLQMGTAMHGISPDADRQTGGAAYWFARVPNRTRCPSSGTRGRCCAAPTGSSARGITSAPQIRPTTGPRQQRGHARCVGLRNTTAAHPKRDRSSCVGSQPEGRSLAPTPATVLQAPPHGALPRIKQLSIQVL